VADHSHKSQPSLALVVKVRHTPARFMRAVFSQRILVVFSPWKAVAAPMALESRFHVASMCTYSPGFMREERCIQEHGHGQMRNDDTQQQRTA
jgi:hypothetical protein